METKKGKSHPLGVVWWSVSRDQHLCCGGEGTDLGFDAVAFQVNGINVEGLRHSEVVSHIKSRENEARLLVVDPETDDYFKKLGVTPTEEHTKGETLPSPGSLAPLP